MCTPILKLLCCYLARLKWPMYAVTVSLSAYLPTYLGITFSCSMQTTRHCHFAVTNLSARTYVNDALCFYAKLPFYIFLSLSLFHLLSYLVYLIQVVYIFALYNTYMYLYVCLHSCPSVHLLLSCCCCCCCCCSA